MAFEADGENIQNDLEEEVTQSLFIMDDQQKIFHIKNEDNVRFACTNVIDFSHHEKLKEINDLRDNDWSHVHLTESTLSFGESTYNLKNKLSIDMTVPQYFFGEEKEVKTLGDGENPGLSEIDASGIGEGDGDDGGDDEDEDEDGDGDEGDNEDQQWTV